MAKKHARAAGMALALAIALCAALLPAPAAAAAPGDTRDVHGHVSQMPTTQVTQGFLQLHGVTVELRETYWAPAGPGLSTKAALMDSEGNGEFAIENVPFGEYLLAISRPGHLTRCMPVSVSASSPSVIELAPPDAGPGGAFELWYGDCDGDLTIGDGDIVAVRAIWNSCAGDGAYDPACDLNSDGRVDNSDSMLLMANYGKSAWDYPGAENADFSAGPGLVNSSVKLALSQGASYRVPVFAKGVSSFAGKAVTITYDQAALRLVTLAEQAYGEHKAAGGIPGTGITVTSVSPGCATLEFEAHVPQGALWTGIISVMRFEALANGTTEVHIE